MTFPRFVASLTLTVLCGCQGILGAGLAAARIVPYVAPIVPGMSPPPHLVAAGGGSGTARLYGFPAEDIRRAVCAELLRVSGKPAKDVSGVYSADFFTKEGLFALPVTL